MTTFGGAHSESTSPARQRIEVSAKDYVRRQEQAAKRRMEAAMECQANEAERRLYEWRPPMFVILSEVAKRHGLKPRDIIGERRWHQLVLARHECWWLSRERLGASSTRIGRYYRRDHSTVLHGCRAHARRIAEAVGA